MGEEEFGRYLDKKEPPVEEIKKTKVKKEVPRFIKTLAHLTNLLFNSIEVIIKLAIVIVGIAGTIVATDVINKLTDYYTLAKLDIQENEIAEIIEKKPTNIYDNKGSLIVTLTTGEEQLFANYGELPIEISNAFIAVEDRNFVTHKGIDVQGIIRVGLNYVKSNGDDVAGASTITQQLVRNTYLSKEVTIERKLKEMCYSIALEETYSKKQIIELYVNNIYFANGYYGIETAAQGYFGKTCKELSLSEIAYLCAIPNRPSYYDPKKDSSRALDRRDKILNDMLECGYISIEECDKALAEEVKLNMKSSDSDNNFVDSFSSYATYDLVKWSMIKNGFTIESKWNSIDEYKSYQEKFNRVYEEELADLKVCGYEVKTTLDRDIQSKMQSALDSNLDAVDTSIGDDGIYELQGASTCIDNTNGKVVGILSGRTQNDVETYLNRGYMGYRQPGSSLKPLVVYTPALESGYTKDSELINVNIDKYKDNKEISGTKYKLSNAVEWSRNGCAYYLMSSITPEMAVDKLSKMKFNRIVPDDYYMSSALGGLTYGVTTLEMSSAYSCLVNGGEFKSATCIDSVKQGDKELYTDEVRTSIYTTGASYGMLDILKGVVTKGTAKGMNWDNKIAEVAGKTGTTNDNKDGWFCGVSSEYSLSVWVGYDNPKELAELMGGTYPANIFKDTMKEITKVKGNKLVTVAEVKAEESVSESVKESVSEELLPGREDNELLSDDYTVGDYREDHKKLDKANELISKAIEEKSDVYDTQIKDIADSIVSRKARDSVNSELKKLINERSGISGNDY